MWRLCTGALISGLWLVPATGGAQGTGEPGDLPDWLYADSILVQEPPWISATVAKAILVLAFRPGTSARRKAAIIRQVHGTVVYHDHSYGSDGDYYVRVTSDPDACGVKQALDVLDRLPEVEWAGPHMLQTWMTDSARSTEGVADGGLTNLPATHKGSQRPCPAGTSLLH